MSICGGPFKIGQIVHRVRDVDVASPCSAINGTPLTIFGMDSTHLSFDPDEEPSWRANLYALVEDEALVASLPAMASYPMTLPAPQPVMRTYTSGATRDAEDGKLDYKGFFSPTAMRRFAEYMHTHRRQADGHLRASDNWKKGIPVEDYEKSLLRHTQDWWLAIEANDTAKAIDLACAIQFNLQGWLHEQLKGMEAQRG